jgi:hypothetical protein
MYVNMFDEQFSNTSQMVRGAALWAHVHVPVITPDDWFIHEIHESLQELERVQRELEAARSLLISALPDSRDLIASLSRKCGISNTEAHRRNDVAKVVRALPETGELLARGQVSSEHIRALSKVLDKVGVAELIGAAASESPEDFTKRVKDFQLASEHGEDIAKRQHAQRSLSFDKRPDGMIGIKGTLPPIDGKRLKERLRALVDHKYRKDHPLRANHLGGHNVDPTEQRMADALLELAGLKPFTDIPTNETAAAEHEVDQGRSESSDACTVTSGPLIDQSSTASHLTTQRSNTTTNCEPSNSEPSSGGQASNEEHTNELVTDDWPPPIIVNTAKPSVIMIFNVDKWEAELLGHGPIPVTASLFDRTRADLYYLFQNMHGEPLKFGRAQKDPSLAQRLAVLARDRHCSYPGCHAEHDYWAQYSRSCPRTQGSTLSGFCR